MNHRVRKILIAAAIALPALTMVAGIGVVWRFSRVYSAQSPGGPSVASSRVRPAPPSGVSAPTTQAKSGEWKESVSGVAYRNDRFSEGPWSVHVVRVERGATNLAFLPTLAFGDRIGLSPLTRQLRFVPKELGRPIAAINGDFYKTENESCPGDPRGLFIRRGELMSAPRGGSAFWVDAKGDPRTGVVEPRLEITWANGEVMALGLNEECTQEMPVLYTGAMGESTRSAGAPEYVLEPAEKGAGAWAPFRLGGKYQARIGSVNRRGNSAIEAGSAVVALPRSLVARAGTPQPGQTISFVLDSTPNLAGIENAIGGGPALIRDGKPQPANVNKSRDAHPRSAMGWDDRHIYLMVVDGRQPGYSVGMTLAQVRDYLISLGCREAMNLDGGGSAEIWMNGKILNRPCYGHERNTATSLVVTRKDP